MRFQFDLVDEPWIPCIRGDDGIVELGLLGTLEHAHEVEEIHDPSPLVTATLHRLLLAILHRCFGPATLEEWIRLWEPGRFDGQVLRAYFNRWRHRFDLFDSRRPFYQTNTLSHKPVSVAKLAPELACGNNPTLFDHNVDGEPPAVTAGKAARLVVAFQSFALSGTTSRPEGESGIAPEGPLVKGATILFAGGNLFETLMLNLIRYSREEPWDNQSEHDRPAWEQENHPQNVRLPLGYLDYLTWQSRRIRLIPELDQERLVVRRVVLAPGARMKPRASELDPQMAYAKNPKRNLRPTDPAWLPLELRPDRALWRDSTALLAGASANRRPPKARDLLSNLIVLNRLPRSARYHVRVYGLCSYQAKIHLWRQERMPIPSAYLAHNELVELLQDALSLAKRSGNLLGASLEKVTKHNDKADRAVLRHILAGATIAYWSLLDLPFTRLLEDIPCSTNQARARWAEAVASAATSSFERATSGLAEGRFMKGVTLARQDLEHGLWKATRPYKEVAND